MKRRWIIAAAAAASLAAASAFALDRVDRGDGGDGMGRFGMGPMGMGMGMGGFGMLSPEDREAFADARIAALHAGLKLTAEQEKLWPPVEEALRGLAKLRREHLRDWREGRIQLRDDLPAALRGMADRQAARAEALRKLADAAGPLYASLDDGQKRRVKMLARFIGHRLHGAMRHAMRDGHGPGDLGGFGSFDRR